MGSSRISTLGWWTDDAARKTRRLVPPESSDSLLLATDLVSVHSSTSLTRSAIEELGTFFSQAAYSTKARDFIRIGNPLDCGSQPIEDWYFNGSSLLLTPCGRISKSARPNLDWVASRLNKVVLPAPFEPRMRCLPAPNSKVAPPSAVVPRCRTSGTRATSNDHRLIRPDDPHESGAAEILRQTRTSAPRGDCAESRYVNVSLRET